MSLSELSESLPPGLANHIETNLHEVVTEVQLYLDCEANSFDHLMLVVKPACERFIGQVVYWNCPDETTAWLGQEIDGKSPWYSLPRAGNKNVDRLATELAKQIIESQ